MKTFLKVILIVIAAVLAVKFLPLTLVLGCILGLGVALLAAAGASLLALGGGVALAVVALLSPLWVPVLAVVGLIAANQAIEPQAGVDRDFKLAPGGRLRFARFACRAIFLPASLLTSASSAAVAGW